MLRLPFLRAAQKSWELAAQAAAAFALLAGLALVRRYLRRPLGSHRSRDAAVGPVYAGIFPRGFAQVALDELARVGAIIVCKDHADAHALLLFAIPERTSPTACMAEEDADAVLELGTFAAIFEVLGAPEALPRPLTAADLSSALQRATSAHSADWRAAIEKPWRATCIRRTTGASATDAIKSPLVERMFSAAVGGCLKASSGGSEPPVDLTSFAVEAVALLSDGVDTVERVRSARAASEAGAAGALLLLGVRRQAGGRVRPASLGVTKGSGVLSRADDSVAFCVASRAADILEPRLLSNEPCCGEVLAADPMCGVGTYPLALRWVLEHRLRRCWESTSTAAAQRIVLLGSDAEDAAVLQARSNAGASRAAYRCSKGGFATIHVDFQIETTSEWSARMEGLGGVDLVLVDPPWGHRHSSFSQVMRSMNGWARDWARALKPGGFALVVTIRTKQFEKEVLSNLKHKQLLLLEETVQFDNKGYAQCKLYILRKPAA